jgi:hypothetical protein
MRSLRIAFDTEIADQPDADKIDQMKLLPDRFRPVTTDAIRYKTHSELRLEGRKTFYSLSGIRDIGNRRLGRQDFTTSFDGTTHKVFNSVNDLRPYAAGLIDAADYCMTATKSRTNGPVFLAVCPLDPLLSHLDIRDPTLAASQKLVDGRALIVLRTKDGKVALLDPGQDYSVVQLTTTNKGSGLNRETHVINKCNADSAWYPKEWICTSYSTKGNPILVEHSIVTVVEINPKFSTEDFHIDFPAGTVVSDARELTKHRYRRAAVATPDGNDHNIGRTGTLDYVVVEGGQRRITWDERTASYDELLRTPSGMAGKPRSVFLSPWLVVFNVVMVISIGILLVWRRIRGIRSM